MSTVTDALHAWRVANKDKVSEYNHRHYEKNKAKLLEKSRIRLKTPAAKAMHRAWLDANKERMREHKRKDYRKHKAKRLAYTNEWRKAHPRTPEYYTDYLKRRRENAAGRPRPEQCEVCGGTDKIHFDHCHERGIFRGWICQSCNKVLGFVRDDPNRLRKLITYLEQSQTLEA